MEGVGRVSEAGAGEVGVCEATNHHCFSVTVTEAARFMSVNRAVAFNQSKYCNFTGVILWLVGAFYSPYLNFSTQSPPEIAFNQYTNRKNESRCLYLHSDWVGKTDVWLSPPLPMSRAGPDFIFLHTWKKHVNAIMPIEQNVIILHYIHTSAT